MSLSFVYPIHNEMANLPRLLPETRRIAEGLVTDYEVLLVDDGSTDGSGPYIDRLAAEHPEVRALHHRRNRGLGAAITTGLRHATKPLVLYMDSDFPVGVAEARAALAAMPLEVDLLIGYRIGRAEGLRRELMSWTYNQIIRRTFGLHVRDVNFAFKLIRRPLLERIRLRSEGSFIDAELLLEAQRLGARIMEVGLHYHPRVAGVSTAASARVVLRLLGEMRAYRLRRRAGRVGPARLIINADDFGLCRGVNQGVIESFARGVVTSASILPTGAAFEEAAALARAHPRLDIGVHLALTQTRPVLSPAEVPSLVDRSGRFPADWRGFLARWLRGAVRRSELRAELRAQVARAQAAGLEISHLDSHQHLHLLPGVLPVVLRLAKESGIGAVRLPGPAASGPPRRWAEGAALAFARRQARGALRRSGLLVPDDFRGFHEAGCWRTEDLARAVLALDGGVTELCCHPGAGDGIEREVPWPYQWQQELAALTSAEVAEAVRQAGVELTTYRECLRAGPAARPAPPAAASFT